MELTEILHHFFNQLRLEPQLPMKIFTECQPIMGMQLHHHPYCEVRFHLTTEDKIERFDITPPMIDHAMIPLAQTPRLMILIMDLNGYLGISFCRDICGDYTSPWIKLFLQRLSAYLGNHASHTIASRTELRMLLGLVLLCATGGKPHPQPTSRINQIIEGIRNFYYQPDLTIASLARQHGISPHYVQHLFKQETGETPRRYLCRTRLEAAKSLLEQQQNSVKEIAALSGFSSPQYFCTVFQHEYGCSPKTYLNRSSAENYHHNNFT